MQKIFYNILLPVNLNNQTEGIVEKAITFANRLDCNLHILYTASPVLAWESFFRLITRRSLVSQKKQKLLELQYRFEACMRPGLLLNTVFKSGNVEKETISYIMSAGIDMIFLGEKQPGMSFTGFNFHRIAAATGCSVLTGNTYRGFRDFEKIVLPIGHSLPVNRIRVATYLAQQLHAAIHLVSVEPQSRSDKNMQYLSKTYQLLKDNTTLPLVCSTFSGDDLGHSALNYARSVNAGLIVVNTDKKTGESSFFRRLLHTSFLHKREIPVMLVE